MKQTLYIIATLALIAAAPAHAAGCFADYKAKRDNPLKLHYGVAELTGACNVKAAANELAARLATDGWVLLNVLSVFEKAGLEERKDSAGQFFLRY